MEKLKKRWNLTSTWQVVAILIVFSINGSFAAWIAKPAMSFIGLGAETINAWLFWPIRILLIFAIYQTTLPIIGWLFGQFKFFWAFEKKMLSRLGLKRFFNEE